jgi:hypothetical protein
MLLEVVLQKLMEYFQVDTTNQFSISVFGFAVVMVPSLCLIIPFLICELCCSKKRPPIQSGSSESKTKGGDEMSKKEK